MKGSEIRRGRLYMAKVNGILTTVRVEEIKNGFPSKGRILPVHYVVTNLSTGRKTTFCSAAKFRCEVPKETKNVQHVCGFCDLCRSLWIERHGTINYDDVKEHYNICSDAGCRHPYVYAIPKEVNNE